MSFISRVERTKKLLATAQHVPDNNLKLKYENANAEEAWDLFFALFAIRFKHPYPITAEIEETKAIQWKALSDIYLFLHDAVEKISQTAQEYVFVATKYGTKDFNFFLKKYYADVTDAIMSLKNGARHCRALGIRYQITQHDLFKKYEKYLHELLSLTPENIFKDFSKNKFPLEGFDENCTNQEGDPIKNIQK